MKNLIQALKELQEEKPGLWANIRAKRARGEKPAHKNSNAHKDAVKAGKKINKMSEDSDDTRAEAIKLKADLKQLKVNHVSAMKKVVDKRGWENPGAVFYKVDFTLKGWDEEATKEEHIEALNQLNIPEGWSIFWWSPRIYMFKGADGPTPLQWIKAKELRSDGEPVELNEGEEWPKEVPSRHGDIIFKLIKVMPDRAKYALLDAETGKEWEPGGRVFGSIKSLMASAEDTIKPQGGRQSSQF